MPNSSWKVGRDHRLPCMQGRGVVEHSGFYTRWPRLWSLDHRMHALGIERLTALVEVAGILQPVADFAEAHAQRIFKSAGRPACLYVPCSAIGLRPCLAGCDACPIGTDQGGSHRNDPSRDLAFAHATSPGPPSHPRFTQGFRICTLGLYYLKPYLNLIWRRGKTLPKPCPPARRHAAHNRVAIGSLLHPDGYARRVRKVSLSII